MYICSEITLIKNWISDKSNSLEVQTEKYLIHMTFPNLMK